MEKRYSILTYIFNGYEILHEVNNPQEDVEYICVTDDPNLKSDTWKIIIAEDLLELSPFDKYYNVRFNPWKYVSTNICIRIDGSMGVNGTLDPIINMFNDYNFDCAVIVHPYRNNFIDEYETWIRHRNYPLNQAVKCINYMTDAGYDFNYQGMIEQNLVIQRNNEVNNKIDKITFDLLKELGNNTIERLDQPITSFVINHIIKEENIKCMLLSEQIIIGTPFFTWYMHNTNMPNMPMYDLNGDEYKYGMFFNKPQALIFCPKVEN